jgi:hypothetical protein
MNDQRQLSLGVRPQKERQMGAEPYWYFVKYQPDIGAALQELREREFRAGRYNPVLPFPPFPVGPDTPAPGAQHRTIRAALRAAGADGTRSILDLEHVSTQPKFGAVAPLSDAVLVGLYGTARPTREMVEQGADSEYIERGQGIYIVLYREDQPDGIFFAGLSCD